MVVVLLMSLRPYRCPPNNITPGLTNRRNKEFDLEEPESPVCVVHSVLVEKDHGEPWKMVCDLSLCPPKFVMNARAGSANTSIKPMITAAFDAPGLETRPGSHK